MEIVIPDKLLSTLKYDNTAYVNPETNIALYSYISFSFKDINELTFAVSNSACACVSVNGCRIRIRSIVVGLRLRLVLGLGSGSG